MKKIFLTIFIICGMAASALAQLDGARVYWPLPKNTNIVGAHVIFGTVNAAWSNWERLQPSVDIQNNLYMLTYTRIQPILNRTAIWTLILPAGDIKTNASLPVPGNQDFINGIGDPGFSATINLFGAPGLKAKEYVRHDLNTTINLGVRATFPVGQYDSDEALNMGSNQFKIRFSMPMVKALNAWIPGKRIALDVMPSITLISKNNDSQGSEVKQDPVLIVESHLSRDMTKKAFVSVDYSFISGGKATITDKATGVVTKTKNMETHLLGATVNFQINDNLQLFLTHMQTINQDSEPVTLQGSLLKATLTWSWHAVLQRAKDFHE